MDDGPSRPRRDQAVVASTHVIQALKHLVPVALQFLSCCDEAICELSLVLQEHKKGTHNPRIGPLRTNLGFAAVRIPTHDKHRHQRARES
jgi:hypothetical protein